MAWNILDHVLRRKVEDDSDIAKRLGLQTAPIMNDTDEREGTTPEQTLEDGIRDIKEDRAAKTTVSEPEPETNIPKPLNLTNTTDDKPTTVNKTLDEHQDQSSNTTTALPQNNAEVELPTQNITTSNEISPENGTSDTTAILIGSAKIKGETAIVRFMRKISDTTKPFMDLISSAITDFLFYIWNF